MGEIEYSYFTSLFIDSIIVKNTGVEIMTKTGKTIIFVVKDGELVKNNDNYEILKIKDLKGNAYIV